MSGSSTAGNSPLSGGRNRRAQHTSRPVPTGLPGHTISEARSEPCSNYPGWAEFPNNINHLWVYASMSVKPVLRLIGGVRAGRPARKKHVLRQRPSRCPAPWAVSRYRARTGPAEPPTQPCRKDTLDSKLQRVSHVHPRPSGRRPIHVPIPPNVPPMGTGPAFRTRCEYSSNGSMHV